YVQNLLARSPLTMSPRPRSARWCPRTLPSASTETSRPSLTTSCLMPNPSSFAMWHPSLTVERVPRPVARATDRRAPEKAVVPSAAFNMRSTLGEFVLPLRAYLREDHRHGPFAIGPAYAVDVVQPGTA